jgi:hypothetical protein
MDDHSIPVHSVLGHKWSSVEQRGELRLTKLNEAATTLPTCHLVMPEDPEKATALIDQAARQVLSKGQARRHTWARSSLGVSAQKALVFPREHEFTALVMDCGPRRYLAAISLWGESNNLESRIERVSGTCFLKKLAGRLGKRDEYVSDALRKERCPGSREREYLQAMHYRAVCP